MAKYASILVQIGFPLDQIGFIVRWPLDAQPFVLRCLLKQKLNLADEMLEKLAIGSEFAFQEKNLVSRDIIIRSGTESSKQEVEKELAVQRSDIYIVCLLAYIQTFIILKEIILRSRI